MISTRSYPKQRSATGTAFRWHWRKNRLLLLLYTLLLMVSLPGCFFLNLLNNMEFYLSADYFVNTTFSVKEVYLAQEMTSYLTEIITWLVIPIAAVFAFLMAYSSFSYLHSRRATALYAALPIRRTPMLMGGILANLLQLFLPLAASLGLVQAIGWGYGDLVYPFSGIVIWEAFLLLALGLTAAYLLFLFMIVISGTLLDTVFSFAVLSVSWPLLWLITDIVCEEVLPGFVSDLNQLFCFALVPVIGTMLPFLNFDDAYCFTTEIVSSTAPEVDVLALPYTPGLSWLVWWLVFVAVMLVLVVVIVRIRKSEYAESTRTFPLPRAFFRMICSAVGGLTLAYLCSAILPSNVVFLVAGLVGTFLTHLFAQAIWGRGLRGFGRTLPAYLLLLVIMGTAGWMVVNDVPGYVAYLPDRSDVASVSVYGDALTSGNTSLDCYLDTYDSGFTYVLGEDEYGEYGSLSVELQDDESIAAVEALHSAALEQFSVPYLPFSGEDGDTYLTITYTLKDGSTVPRSYYWTLSMTDTLRERADAVLALEEYREVSLLQSYEARNISDITYCRYSVEVDEDGWEYEDEEISAYNVLLTDEQKAQLWETFLSELYSEDFCYDENEEYSDADGDGYREDCIIIMSALSPEDFTPELTALLEERLGEDAAQVWQILGQSYRVPNCCTETCRLMREYATGTTAEEDDTGTTAEEDTTGTAEEEDDAGSTEGDDATGSNTEEDDTGTAEEEDAD
ncbi:MAG: hypothetical protein LUF84_04745 [Clostridiales bacterium]|nr:hypothetical protein [Clostridiales bacterium]